jgi:hypothetical protein
MNYLISINSELAKMAGVKRWRPSRPNRTQSLCDEEVPG